jgi:hypothetical protein
MKPDFFRVNGIPLQVILKLDDINLEDDAAEYLMKEHGLVTAWNHEEKTKLVLTAPDNSNFAYFRVRVKDPNNSLRPFLDFKYLPGFYKSTEFLTSNPMKGILVGTYLRYKNHITGVLNMNCTECDFPYELPLF